MQKFPKLTNKRILVTGGAGFIGSNLCEELIINNNEVVCLDNFSTGKIENIKEFIEHKNFKLLVGDIRRLEDCQKAVDGIDIVFHEAALGSVPRSIKDPILSSDVNINGFINMLVASRDAKIQKFIYAASSSAYGDSECMPKIEENIGKPLSTYAVTKYVNELYAYVFGLNYGMNTIGLRYFNVFGKKQDPDGAYAAVIPKFIKSLMKYEKPIINGNGSNSRDFTYIKNIIQINILAGIVESKEVYGQVFNAAYGEKNTINVLFENIKRILTNYDCYINNIKPIYGPYRNGDVSNSLAEIKKSKELLGYNPYYNLEQGLKETIEWYWNNTK